MWKLLDLGMRGFRTSTLTTIWETAKDLDVDIFVHPWNMEWCDPKY